ncbi:serine hydrolase domain-containing protein [Streptococcus equi]|uniref:serine hydrolase domain-containing protein n=1 Tax=Streptococcus equi TaxID=1336 RepID=UPI0005B974E5|nr:serine hydrolase domain-containing protein [Streptococcus equi]VTP90663.1 esterase [Streptococcus equi subsp. zooepidemicus]KIS20462.1 esterase [Streptococcus equi subsp. zooepidemicus SzAM35]HEK9995962.1 beta-lactamase family protein [Streptococcus equi subsp. zooepidemicus]HEL0583057.1 beta-lactamase family protein [Streptococcus equi subsp. zooepidemicus]HEL0596536.1 beta-lactamase family protein [Streptococcus equi subsp. zooepidemicus]
MTLEVIEKVSQQIQEGLYHGASLALFRCGGWQEHYIGTLDGQRPVTKGLVYDLASVSKVVGVATVCIAMINSGALVLDTPLRHYYPDAQKLEVTLRQLLTHTSGLDPYIPNRDQLNAQQLRAAMHQLQVKDDKTFHYTDVNFLLLGFMLEHLHGKSLDELFQEMVFTPFGMTETSFGPRPEAVPTVKGVLDGEVHDPKAKVLGKAAGSAGLFSTLRDLELFIEHYLKESFSDRLFQSYSRQEKPRSLGWSLEGDWISHTGYTGPFIMLNKKEQQAAIFLTNRTYDKDDRALWIKERRQLRDAIYRAFDRNSPR